MHVAERHEDGLRLLRRLAEFSEGSTSAGFLLDRIGADVGLDRRGTKRAFSALHEDGLVELAGPGPRVAITHAGLEAAEQPTPVHHHAAPQTQINIICVETLENSQVQQASQGSIQSRTDQS